MNMILNAEMCLNGVILILNELFIYKIRQSLLILEAMLEDVDIKLLGNMKMIH